MRYVDMEVRDASGFSFRLSVVEYQRDTSQCKAIESETKH
jgi:hypothetical protein